MKALIIDDERNCCNTLQMLLQKHCGVINEVKSFNTAEEGLLAIREERPEIVFLDIEMPRMDGFQMLMQLSAINFHLIFTTSFDQYALKAFRFSAVDYLLKPIDKGELIAAIEKVSKMQRVSPEQISLLLQKIYTPNTLNKIALPTMEGLQMLPVQSILYAEADNNYTILHLKNKARVVVSITLKDMQELLQEHAFVRVHRRYVVNLNEVEKYVKGEGGYLMMSDNVAIDVSRSKKDFLLKSLLPNRE